MIHPISNLNAPFGNHKHDTFKFVDCVAMDPESIVQALKSACGNRNLKFQVIIQNSKLHIYINYKTEEQPESEFLIDRASNAIAPLPLEAFKGAWLYSRKLGEIEPNWQTYLKFPLETNTDNMETIGITTDITNYTDVPQDDSSGNTDLPKDTGMIHKAAVDDEEIDTFAQKLIDENESTEDLYHRFDLESFDEQNSSGDTDLLKNTGMIHKAALYEAEVNTFVSRLTEEKENSQDVTPLNSNGERDLPNDSSVSPDFNLTQYCFVVNKKILTGDILPPDKETIRLVKFFHHLSDNNKQKILPILDDYFKLAKIPDIEKLSVAVQNWFKQITELDDTKRSEAEIWLSRYCFDSNATIEEFKNAAGKQAAIAAQKKQKRSNTEYGFTPVNREPESFSESAVNVDDEPIAEKSHISPVVQKYILPLTWTIATVILIILGIFTTNSQAASQANPSICNGSIGSADYCRLGVNLVGEKKIEQSSPSIFPLTEVTEAEAKRGCERYANVKAGMTKNFDPQKTPVLSSYGEKILPHIYVVEAIQKSVKQLGNVRVGCVYATGKGERSPDLLEADIIPQNWPTEKYQSQTASQSDVSFGIFTNVINLGVYTIFTAIGIAIASKLNIGIEISQLQTIYLVALVIAMVQVVAGINLVASTILPILVMVASSLILKDFRLNKNFGYPLIAGGIFIVIATQFLLYGLFQLLINSLV